MFGLHIDISPYLNNRENSPNMMFIDRYGILLAQLNSPLFCHRCAQPETFVCARNVVFNTVTAPRYNGSSFKLKV